LPVPQYAQQRMLMQAIRQYRSRVIAAGIIHDDHRTVRQLTGKRIQLVQQGRNAAGFIVHGNDNS
jgi:hypothetical protein